MPVGLRMQGAAELVVGLGAAGLRDRSRRGRGRCVHHTQASGHRRGGRSALAVFRPSASTSAAACVLIDDRHRQAVQVPGRVDDRAEVDRRHDGREHRGEGDRRDPDLLVSQTLDRSHVETGWCMRAHRR